MRTDGWAGEGKPRHYISSVVSTHSTKCRGEACPHPVWCAARHLPISLARWGFVQ